SMASARRRSDDGDARYGSIFPDARLRAQRSRGGGSVMVGKTPVPFDPETIMVLKEVLDDAWARLRPEQQANTLKTTLAQRIFRFAAHGERDRERLLDAALEGDGAA